MRSVTAKVSEEDRMRSDLYGLLARLLLVKPDNDILNNVSALHGDETPLGEAFTALARVAAGSDQAEVGAEYDALFIGMTRGEVLPYGSYYLTGFLNEKPLAVLRNAMIELGIEREPARKEPEDHMGALMEMMAGLIRGAYGHPASLETQARFFHRHIEPWGAHLFADIEKAASSRFYQPVGTIGRLFINIERDAFEMDAARLEETA